MTALAGAAVERARMTPPAGEGEGAAVARTLDLAALAGVGRRDRVEVAGFHDRTQDLFERTLTLLEADLREAGQSAAADSSASAPARPFMPEHEDLRSCFLFAEAVGSYATLTELLDAYSPGYLLSQRYDSHPKVSLSEPERLALEEYLEKINAGLEHAHRYLTASAASDFSAEELVELHTVLIAARERSEKVTAILGAHLIGRIEDAVERLHAFRQQARAVQRSVGGIFLVDSEVMFLPTSELIRHVQTIFSGIGNAYLAEHVDGTMLLAARNLLIEVVAFYAYYGRQRIYELYRRNAGMLSSKVVTRHIRTEIHTLFGACQSSNKLILRRVMRDAEREFELSVAAIQAEAERSAVEAVRRLLPDETPPARPAPRGLLRRFIAWLRGA